MATGPAGPHGFGLGPRPAQTGRQLFVEPVGLLFFRPGPYGFHARRPVTPRCNWSPAGSPMVFYGFPIVS